MKHCITEDEISLVKLLLGVIMISTFKWLLDMIDKGAEKVRSLQLALCIFFIFWFPFAGWEDATLRIPVKYLHDFWYVIDVVLMLFIISVAPLIVKAIKNGKNT